MKTPSLVLLTAFAAMLFGADLSAAAKPRHISVREVSIYATIGENRPEVIDLYSPTYVETMDVNWRGGIGRSVTARIFADGVEAWSGMVPAYDPTFRATIRKVVTQIEIRVEQGSAYANWAKLYLIPTGHAVAVPTAGPEFIGTLSEADDLARQTVFALRELQETLPPENIRASVLPLKKAAAAVFAIAKASGRFHQADTARAVLALEQEFVKQDLFLKSLLESNDTFETGLTLMTIRERYRALFGSVSYN